MTLGRLFNFPNLYFPNNKLDILITYLDFPGVSVVKNPSANAGDLGLIPGSGRSPGEENGNPLQYSGLENPMDRSLVGYSPWGRKELDTTEQLHFPFDPDGFMYVF